MKEKEVKRERSHSQRLTSISLDFPVTDATYPKTPISDDTLDKMVFDIKGWEVANGLVMRTAEHIGLNDIGKTLPVTLIPSKFPREIFNQAVDVQTAMNKLQFLVSLDYEFLRDSLVDVAADDEFTRRMLDIYGKIVEEGMAQRIVSQTVRSDYMTHSMGADTFSLKQVEVNTGMIGSAAYIHMLSDLHKNTLRTLGVPEETIREHVPENHSFDSIVNPVLASWRAYGSSKAIVLMVMEIDDPVACEFYLIERLFRQKTNNIIQMEKMCLRKDSHRVHLDEKTKTLYYDQRREVAVVFFMGAIVEKDYECDRDWDTRLLLERSRAVKNPFIGANLGDTKKIQQVLSKPGVLERFFPDEPETVAAIRSTFVGQWGLENSVAVDGRSSSRDEIVERAIEDPGNFVLKSQRESGTGVNYFNGSVAVKLIEMTRKERATYVLMERIWPAVHQNYLIRPMEATVYVNCTSELGIFGYLIGDAKTGRVLENRATGHLLKTKPETVLEAGIANGMGTLDTVFLVD